MKPSILYVSVAGVLAFCVFITLKARNNRSITPAEAGSVHLLLLVLFIWTLVSTVLGIRGLHASPALMERVPLLWQACVPVAVVGVGLLLSRNFRSALSGIASGTPWHWVVLLQALRIGALGGVVKGIRGEVTSNFVFWVGVPDFLYGVSALVMGRLVLKKAVGNGALMAWNLIGAAIILLPTFLFMNHWMQEPGFVFIFEFPMVLAPSIVVPMLVLFNLLLAWRAFELRRRGTSAV
jgi:hypothetical protein